MKKFLALAAMMVIGTAHAEELKFGDMNYFLKQGQFNIGADAIRNNETARLAKTTDVEVDGYLLNTHYAYAFTDSLNVTLGLNFLLDGETDKPSVDASGLQNPTIGANYRLINQSAAGVNVDFGAVASVKVQEREVAASNKDGNSINPYLSSYADPRNSLEVNARVGKKWNEANEFYLLAGAVYHMDGEYKQLGDTKNDMDSSLDFKLGATYQYRPVHEFMMALSLNATRFGEMDGTDSSSDITRTDFIDYQFGFTAKYLINESLIAKFIFTHDRRDSFTVENDTTGDIKFDKRNAGQYGLGIDYIF